MLPEGVEELIRRAFVEDIGPGDHTTLATIPAEATAGVHLLIKGHGVLAGVELAEAACTIYDPSLNLRILIRDGASVVPNDVAFTITGPTRSLLTCERVILNFMQRMSGVATLTRKFKEELDGTKCVVLDTRKTTPTLRSLEKWAVRIGGGVNHRNGLFDMILIKDNHVDLCGGLQPAISAALIYSREHGLELPIVVETRTMKEVEKVLNVDGVDRILLDNFTPTQVAKAVALINGRMPTEASGGITLENARKYADAGVGFISVGALTHSAASLDMSLKAL